jgi:hypothetical protein
MRYQLTMTRRVVVFCVTTPCSLIDSFHHIEENTACIFRDGPITRIQVTGGRQAERSWLVGIRVEGNLCSFFPWPDFGTCRSVSTTYHAVKARQN